MSETEIDWRLVTAHLTGEATPAEEAALHRWIADDPARAAMLRQLREAWEAAPAPPVTPRDTEAAWARVRARIGGGTPVLPLRHPATPPRRRRLPEVPVVLRAAAVVLLLLVPALLWTPLGERLRGGSVALEEVRVPKGGQLGVYLSDGSHVTLGPESTLRYPRHFGRRAREVHIEGMGYFEVARDEARPFTVHARGSATRVLGTAFVVRAYPEDPQVSVAVTSGRVTLRAEDGPDDAAIALEPGEVGRMSPDGSTARSKPASLEAEVGWTRGRLTLEDRSLRDALRHIGRWYDVELVVADSALAARRITTTLEKRPEESLDDVLSLIALSVDARYERSGDTVVFRPRSR